MLSDCSCKIDFAVWIWKTNFRFFCSTSWYDCAAKVTVYVRRGFCYPNKNLDQMEAVYIEILPKDVGCD